MPLQIWLPGDGKPPAHICNVPINMDGESCGAKFYEGERSAWLRHVARCARDHEQEIRSLHIFQRGRELFQGGDHELFKWAKDNGPQILEGRKRL